MLRFTGHAFVDAGIAGMMAYAGKSSPEALTEADFERIAGWLAELYTTPGAVQRHIRGMVFFNAGYYVANPVIRNNFLRRVLYSWKSPHELDETCIFCECRAAYRANREELPLLNGRGIVNFNSNGVDGTPVCGLCSLAIQMLPVVSVKSERLLMVMTSDHPEITIAFARENYRRFRQFLTLQDDTDMPGLPFTRTRFVESCLQWFARSQRTQQSASLTAYCFTNYGSGADIQILRLDASVFEWLDDIFHAYDASLREAWSRAARLAWTGSPADEAAQTGRNKLYEALLALPHQSHVVLGYLMRTAHWGLIESFVVRIMDMSPEMIVLLRQIGVRFAAYAQEHRRFFYEFAREEEFGPLRRILLRAADDCKRRYGQTLISFDEFLQVFTTPDKEYNEWRLPRDLIVLLMIERLDIPASENPFTDSTNDDTEEN